MIGYKPAARATALVFGVSIGLGIVVLASQTLIGQQIPEPRAPLVPRITSVEQLVPFAKVVVQRDYIGQRLGYSVRGGERVLYRTSTRVHPWVREAFFRALKELNCRVDMVVQDRPPRDGRAWAEEILLKIRERLALDFNTRPEKRYGFGGSGGPRTSPPGISISEEEAAYYDVIVGSGTGLPGLSGVHAWTTPELLASSGTLFPGDLMDLIDQKAWEIIRNTVRVEITGLQGSDASFTWHPEWWEVIEGTHPTIRNPGYESTFGTERPGRSEYAYFAGHLAAFAPGYAAIPRTDFKGKLVATLGQEEPLPKITIQHDRGEITSIEGGSHYGDMWREVVERTEDIQYPGYPRPGTGWLNEFAIGTNPKIIGPMEVEELKGDPERDPRYLRWPFSRDRTGVVHAGYGTLAASWWAKTMDMPVNHYHLRLFFLTYTAHTRDGRTVKLLDRGHLTVLDDPEVRALAAKYGDPDEILSEDWIPVLTPDRQLAPPKAKMVSYQKFLEWMPFDLDDPRLVYARPDHLDLFYGRKRVEYYKPQEYLDFYRKLGQIPVRRVERE